MIGHVTWSKIWQTVVCSVVRFERGRNDDSRTSHVLDDILWVACMAVLQFLRTESFVGNLLVCVIILSTMSQIYKSWNMHDSNCTRTGACITQNQKNCRSRKLNHKHSHSPNVQEGLLQHLSFQIYYVLKTINNQC